MIRERLASILVAGGLLWRENASDAGPMATLSELRYMNVTAQWGGNATTNSTPNYGNIVYYVMQTYPDIIGQIAFVIIFSIPFWMLRFRTDHLLLAGILGFLIGGYIYLRLSSQYLLAGVACLVISIVAILYSLLQRS